MCDPRPLRFVHFLTMVLLVVSRSPAEQDASGNPLSDAVAAAVARLSGGADPLLPAGTVLESLAVDPEAVARVVLALPAGAVVPTFPESRAERIDEVIRGGIASIRQIRGLGVQIRSAGTLRSLGSLVQEPSAPAPVVRSVPDVVRPKAAGAELASPGGPLANADGQPAGALSGVVVFCTGGHGWTVGSAGWVLQRPLLFSMVEDYGNIDQLNCFVHYLYNAGATVVPFRPVGYQDREIVLDNDDPGVTWTGAWSNSSDAPEYYENGVTGSGVRYRYTTSSLTETATARYTPNIPAADFYPVYCWTRDNTDRVKQLYRIRHSGGTAEVRIDHQVVGKGWIWLGNFHFEAGTSGYVEISNQASTISTVVADAIRFGNGMGSVRGGNLNTVSGYGRDEEAQRYWAESEAGINAEGLPSSIWDSADTDTDDNVGTAARWAREMNRTDVNNDRWRRVYIEFHSNAADGRGVVGVYNDIRATTNQIQYARILGEKLEADMLAIDDRFEYPWGEREPNTYFRENFAYGAISTANNSNEFDAALLEVAFHDNMQDAALMRDLKVRDAIARSTVQGIVQFLSDPTIFPGTQVPTVFLPDPPERVEARYQAGAGVVVSWQAGPSRPSSPASGDFATSYKIYRSSNGYGFGQGVDVGNNLSTTLTDIPAGETTYLRVAACNAGGESMPSETLAVRVPSSGPAQVLIVNGYDRVDRKQDLLDLIPAGTIERTIPRVVNSFDYIVQHASAVGAAGVSFDSCSNEAIVAGQVPLRAYQAVVWILGRESETDRTFDATEQSLLTNWLAGGGGLFVSGTDIGYELDSLNAGRTFYENILRADWVADDAATFTVSGTGGIMQDVPAFSFSTQAGAPYVAFAPDRIAPRAGAVQILSYGGGMGAGIQYDSGGYRVVMLALPFETIGSPAVRNDIMARAMAFLLSARCIVSPIADFEGQPDGAAVLFREPRFSTATQQHLLESPNLAAVTSEVAAYDGSQVCKVQWQWADTAPGRWLRLTTADTPGVANPAIDLHRPVRLRLRLDSGSLRVALGVRETNVDVPIGADGGTTGTIEWVGADSVVDGAPQGLLVTAQPGTWQTITFLPAPAAKAYTGDGVLWTPTGRGVLEHLALSPVEAAGPLTVYIDGVEQACPPRADFDGDGDVDQADFGYLQLCFSGVADQNNPKCARAHLDSDSDVDDTDFALFMNCFSGANTTASPECTN